MGAGPELPWAEGPREDYLVLLLPGFVKTCDIHLLPPPYKKLTEYSQDPVVLLEGPYVSI